jgi:hypothetical protein
MGRILETHPELKREVSEMLEISRMLRQNFRVDASEQEELGPAPGFYARVMARVEADVTPQSFWNFFADPAFGGRLVFASLALAFLLFSASFFMASPEAEQFETASGDIVRTLDEPVLGAVLVADEQDLPVAESADLELNRGAALAQLTAYNQ